MTNEKKIANAVNKALWEKDNIESEAAHRALDDFMKVVPDDGLGGVAEYSREQMLHMFKKGVQFAQTWKCGPADLNEDKLVIIYNPEADDYDIAWYDKVGEGTFYAYLEELMPVELYAKIVERQVRNDIQWNEEDEKAYQEYLKEKGMK